MPLEGVGGGSGHSWNILSRCYRLYLDHSKLSSLLQSFRCGLHGQIKENFFSVVWQIIVIVKPIHLSFTHTVPQSERKKNTNYFQTVIFCYDQS